MKFYIERRDGMIRVQQKVATRLHSGGWFRTLRAVTDTPENYKDILRWADFVGHTLEKRRSE